MKHIKTPRLSGPFELERTDNEDGSITYEVWDLGKDTYHRVCRLEELYSPFAKMEAEVIVRALNALFGHTERHDG